MATYSNEDEARPDGKRRRVNEDNVKITNSDINDVAFNTSLSHSHLQHLFLQLGLSITDIENVERISGTRDFKLQAVHVLSFWRQTRVTIATRKVLLDALEKCHLLEAKLTLETKWSAQTLQDFPYSSDGTALNDPHPNPRNPSCMQPQTASSFQPSQMNPWTSQQPFQIQHTNVAQGPSESVSSWQAVSGYQQVPRFSPQHFQSAFSSSFAAQRLPIQSPYQPQMSETIDNQRRVQSSPLGNQHMLQSPSSERHPYQLQNQTSFPPNHRASSIGAMNVQHPLTMQQAYQRSDMTLDRTIRNNTFHNSGNQHTLQPPSYPTQLQNQAPFPPNQPMYSRNAMSLQHPISMQQGHQSSDSILNRAMMGNNLCRTPDAGQNTQQSPSTQNHAPFHLSQPASPGITMEFQQPLTMQQPHQYSGHLSPNFDLEECRRQLILFYIREMSNVQLLPWCDEMRNMEDIYVTLKLKSGFETDANLKNNEDLVCLKLSHGLQATRILIQGVAGSGKSTLLAMLAFKWAQQIKDSSLARYQLLFMLSLREVKSASLIDEIFEQIFETDTTVSKDGLEAFIKSNPQKVLLLIDGLDEYSNFDVSSPVGSLQEILVFKRLRECCTILSTRPHRDLQEHQSRYLIVDVLGFSRKKVEVYMNKFFTGNNEMIQGLKKRIKESDKLISLSTIPVILMLMCYLWEGEQKLPDTQTQLYQDFVIFLWKKYCKRNYKNVNFDENMINKEFDSVISKLGCLALDGLVSKNVEEKLLFIENDFQLHRGLYDMGCETGLLTKERLRRRLNRNSAVTFLHKSFQEFCAARYWANLYVTNPDQFKQVLTHLTSWKALMSKFDIVKFCCGLLIEGGVVTVIQHVVQLFKKNNKTIENISIGFEKPEVAYNNKNIVNILTLLYESQHTLDGGNLDDNRSSQHPNIAQASHQGAAASNSVSDEECDCIQTQQSTGIATVNTLLTQAFESIFPSSGCTVKVDDKYPQATSTFLKFVNSKLGFSVLSRLENLTLVNTYILPNLKALCEFAHKSTDLRLYCSTENTVGMLLNAVQQCNTLISLDLSGGLWKEYIDTLSEYLSKFTNLQVMNLSENHLGEHLISLVRQLQQCTKLSTLNLHTNSLREEHIEALSESLAKLTSLQELNLSQNIVSKALIPLAKHLQHCTMLRKLRLHDTYIKDEGVIALSKGFVSMTNLTHLDLGRNINITNTGVDALFKHVHHLTKLEDLTLEPRLDNRCSALVKECLADIEINLTGESVAIYMHASKCQSVRNIAMKYLWTKSMVDAL